MVAATIALVTLIAVIIEAVLRKEIAFAGLVMVLTVAAGGVASIIARWIVSRKAGRAR